MSEVTFAKSFLATLDKRAIKLAADHVSDPRKHPNQSPFVLPKQTNPFPRKSGPTSTQQAKDKSVNATLKPMRAGETVVLSNISLDSSIYDVKTQYAEKSGLPQDKIKLLLNKKPTTDIKTLKELGISEDVEFSVMVMGGASTPSTTPAPEKAPPAVSEVVPIGDKMEVDDSGPAPDSERAQVEADQAQLSEPTTKDFLQSDEFWADLTGFLTQRLRDEKEGESLAVIFREAWNKQR